MASFLQSKSVCGWSLQNYQKTQSTASPIGLMHCLHRSWFMSHLPLLISEWWYSVPLFWIHCTRWDTKLTVLLNKALLGFLEKILFNDILFSSFKSFCVWWFRLLSRDAQYCLSFSVTVGLPFQWLLSHSHQYSLGYLGGSQLSSPPRLLFVLFLDYTFDVTT